MNILTDMTILFKSGFSTKHYYKAFNRVYKQFFGEYYMLHYPLYKNDQDNLLQCQKNLIDYCLGKLPSLIGENVLEIGCGNGIEALYIYKKYTPAKIVGIDLNEENIKIANLEKERQNIQNIDFFVSDAQDVKQIDDNSIDIVINIESAFHYPDKEKYLSEVLRVLKPGGRFVIADILTRKKKSNSKSGWGKKMNFYHWPLDRYRDILSKSDLAVDTWVVFAVSGGAGARMLGLRNIFTPLLKYFLILLRLIHSFIVS